MTEFELMKLRAQRSILLDVAREYPGRTIENIIQNMDARIKANEKRIETPKCHSTCCHDERFIKPLCGG